MNITEKQINIFDMPEYFALAHCISGDFKMGAGIAKDFTSLGIKSFLLQTYPNYEYKNKGGCLYSYIPETKQIVFNLVTKAKYYQKPTYRSLEESLVRMKSHIQNLENYNICIQNLALPKIGCGLDRLDWNKVKALICKTFEDTNLNIAICSM